MLPTGGTDLGAIPGVLPGVGCRGLVSRVRHSRTSFPVRPRAAFKDFAGLYLTVEFLVGGPIASPVSDR